MASLQLNTLYSAAFAINIDTNKGELAASHVPRRLLAGSREGDEKKVRKPVAVSTAERFNQSGRGAEQLRQRLSLVSPQEESKALCL